MLGGRQGLHPCFWPSSLPISVGSQEWGSRRGTAGLPLKPASKPPALPDPYTQEGRGRREERLNAWAWGLRHLSSGTGSILESRGHKLVGGRAWTRQTEEAWGPC